MNSEDSDDEWIDDAEVPLLAQAKVLVLKICRRRCIVHAQSESAMEVAEPVLKLMFTLLANGGSVNETDVDEYVIREVYQSDR